MSLDLEVFRFVGRVDPDGVWLGGGFRLFGDEAFRVPAEGVFESGLPGGVYGVGLTVMDLVGGHQADAAVVMILIVPVEEASAEVFGLLGGFEALWEFRLIFQGFEVGFREGVVVGRVGSAMGFGDAQVGEHHGGGLGFHRGAPVGMQGELAGGHVVPGDDVLKQLLEQAGVFGVRDTPSDDAAAEDVDDDVEIKVGPLNGAHQLCDVPGPHLVGAGGQQFGFGVDRMATLSAALAHFAMLAKVRYMVRIEQ